MESVEFLGRYRLTQSDACFKLGRDSVLLARFCTLRPRWSVCDLGCGVGSLLLLLSQREEALDLARRAELCRQAMRRCAETDLAMKSVSGADAKELLVSLVLELAAGGTAC